MSGGSAGAAAAPVATKILLRQGLGSCAGLIAGPSAWAASTQLGLLLPYVDCRHRLHTAALAAFLAALASLAGAWVSWRAQKQDMAAASRATEESRRAAAFGFAASLSALLGPIFAFALLLQGISALVLTGCER